MVSAVRTAGRVGLYASLLTCPLSETIRSGMRIDLNVLCDLVERLSGLFIMAYRAGFQGGLLHNVILPRSWFINLMLPGTDLRKDASAFFPFAFTMITLMRRIDVEIRQNSTPAPVNEEQSTTPALNTKKKSTAPAPDTKGKSTAPASDAKGQSTTPAPGIKEQSAVPIPNIKEQSTAPTPDTKGPSITDGDGPTDSQDPMPASSTERQFTVDGDKLTDFMGPLYIARM